LPEVSAQSEGDPHFFGINPSVTVEPFYGKGELDINILPFVYQKPITNRFDFRLTTILNLGIRKGGNEISHFGVEAAFPIFFKKRETASAFSKGLFVSPVIGLTRNRIEEHNNLGLWLEPGYNLLFENKFAMSFGLQVGRTYFDYDTGSAKWENHFGVKVVIGRWVLL
jgi:hypothetical protein